MSGVLNLFPGTHIFHLEHCATSSMKLPSLKANGMPKAGSSITTNKNGLFDKNELPRWEADGVELYKPLIHKIFPGSSWWVGSNVWWKYTGVQT